MMSGVVATHVAKSVCVSGLASEAGDVGAKRLRQPARI